MTKQLNLQMLNKLAIFNSQKHAKVVIKLDDATAIQIIGENKIGKTTLIDTLNFLYIIDPQRMSFDSRAGKSTYTFKQSIHHFFPTHNQSYIVFECFKGKAGGYFCVLVKRKTTEDNVEYYKINKHFDEDDYISPKGELKKFEDIRKNLALTDSIQALKDKSELFQYVYNKDSKQNAFVWINDKVKRKGQSLENSLSKTYLFLLNASSIDDNALREALIIADNRQGLALDVFSNKSKMDTVEKLKREGAYITKLNTIKVDFEKFKLIVNTYETRKKLVGELLYSFDYFLEKEVALLNTQIQQSNKQIEIYQKEEQIFKPQETNFAKQIGSLNTNISNLQREKISPKEIILKEINEILQEVSPFHNTVELVTELLETQKQAFQKEFDEVSASLQSIVQYSITQKEVENKIGKADKEQEQLENKINKYQDLLIHNISEIKEVREKLNAIFSKEVTAILTQNDIVEKLYSITDILRINEGKIKGFDKIRPESLESVADLREQLKTVQKDLQQQKDILDTIKNRTEKENHRDSLQTKISDIETKIKKINKKESIETELFSLKTELENLRNDLQEKDEKLEKISEELTKVSNLITQHQNSITGFEKKINTYTGWYDDFEQDRNNITLIENLIEKPLEILHQELKKEKRNLEVLQGEKHRKFSELQRLTENYTAEPIFIEQINQDILTIKDKEKSIEILLDQISNDFTKPVADFLEYYRHFEGFIKSFNRSISEYKISDLTALKIDIKVHSSLYTDLEKISKIIRVDDFKTDLFNQFNSKEQQEYLKTLEEYINNRNRHIEFKELFSISLIADDENGKSKSIDLRKGNESQGTIRMINLILFLLVIKFFKVQDDENKLVFFIDEDVIDSGNTAQLVRFCKENGFVVIFAAKHQIIGLEKYYFIKKSVYHQNKVYADERNVTFAQKK